MNLNTARNAIIHFVLKREGLFRRLFMFCLTLTCFLVINNTYGYMGVLKNEWLAVAISILCAFIPFGFVGGILFVFLSIHLLALSVGICIVFVIIWFVFFFMSAICGARAHFHLMLLPVFYTMHIPFLIPVYEGFFGKRRNAIPIVGASVLAFFLRTVKIAEQVIKGNDAEINAFIFLKDNMLANINFYLFVIATATIFLIISLVKYLPVKGAWILAIISAVVAEFLLILIGYMFTSSTGQVQMLVISNVITLIFGLVISVLFGEVKVNSRRILNFEDDDYDYYVICTPKVRIEKTNKRVVRFTRSKKEIEEQRRTENVNE